MLCEKNRLDQISYTVLNSLLTHLFINKKNVCVDQCFFFRFCSCPSIRSGSDLAILLLSIHNNNNNENEQKPIVGHPSSSRLNRIFSVFVFFSYFGSIVFRYFIENILSRERGRYISIVLCCCCCCFLLPRQYRHRQQQHPLNNNNK